MRTTLTLEPDVTRLIEEEVHRVRKPFKQVVNEALRRGLTAAGTTRSARPYRVAPHRSTLQPGIDRAKLNALVDEQEDAAVLARRKRRNVS